MSKEEQLGIRKTLRAGTGARKTKMGRMTRNIPADLPFSPSHLVAKKSRTARIIKPKKRKRKRKRERKRRKPPCEYQRMAG